MYEHDDVEQEMLIQVLERVFQASSACERGVIALRNDGHAGIAMVAPNCLLFAEVFHPAIQPFDLCLN